MVAASDGNDEGLTGQNLNSKVVTGGLIGAMSAGVGSKVGAISKFALAGHMNKHVAESVGEIIGLYYEEQTGKMLGKLTKSPNSKRKIFEKRHTNFKHSTFITNKLSNRAV